jgi:hypothetical protein
MSMSEERKTESSGRPTSSNISKAVEMGKEYTVDLTDTSTQVRPCIGIT